MAREGDLTSVLNGDATVSADEERQIYEEVRRHVAAILRGESGGLMGHGTGLNVTSVVHEAWIKLQSTKRWNNRAHFFGAVSRATRQILIDEARSRNVRGHPSELRDDHGSETAFFSRVLELEDALEHLRQGDERAARVAELKLYGDFPTVLIAEILDVTPRTVQRDWAYARAFLAAELAAHGPGHSNASRSSKRQ
jgi:RNA polymerase sigma factor (TIGR02999 family)